MTDRPVALVTGSSRGIGRAVLERLSESHDCVVHYRSNLMEAEKVASRIRDRGARAMVVRADIGSEQDIDAMFDGQPFVVDSEPVLKRGGASRVRAYVKNGPSGHLVHGKIIYSNH